MSFKSDFAARMGFGDNDPTPCENPIVEVPFEEFNSSRLADRMRATSDAYRSVYTYGEEVEASSSALLQMSRPILSFAGGEHLPVVHLLKMYNAVDVSLMATQNMVCPWVVSWSDDKKFFFSCSLILSIAISRALHGVTED